TIFVYVPRTEVRTVTVEKDGKKVMYHVTVTVPVYSRFASKRKAESCKFFTVGRNGTLETLAADKAAAQLKKATPVLLGDNADLDPRHLELIKPGTLFLVLPSWSIEPVLPERP